MNFMRFKMIIMKYGFLLFIFLVPALEACRFEHKVVEEAFPDGSPKHVCIYRGKGQERQLIMEIFFYSNGQKRMEGSYKDKKRDGMWTYWYENGNLWSQGTYANGQSEGKRTTYFENGKIRYEGSYKQDMRVGKWKFYDETGKLLGEKDYSAP